MHCSVRKTKWSGTQCASVSCGYVVDETCLLRHVEVRPVFVRRLSRQQLQLRPQCRRTPACGSCPYCDERAGEVPCRVVHSAEIESNSNVERTGEVVPTADSAKKVVVTGFPHTVQGGAGLGGIRILCLSGPWELRLHLMPCRSLYDCPAFRSSLQLRWFSGCGKLWP